MKLLLPTILEERPEAVAGVEYVFYDPAYPIPSEHHDAEALVVWGMSRSGLRKAATVLHDLRWVQTLGAGADAPLAAGFARRVIITSGRGLHNRPVAEHTLALSLAAARRLHELRDAQTARRWASDLGGVQKVYSPGEFRSLNQARVVIWGYGEIAQALAPMYKMLGATVTGVARQPGIRNGVEVVTTDQIEHLLPQTDLLVMLLPATPSTKHALTAGLISLLPAHAWVVNVGRGVTIDEGSLIRALSTGKLGGAALDVFDEEPLPPSSPLWGLKNVIVSPHAAGGRPIGAATLVQENLGRLLSGQPLKNLVSAS